MDKGYHSGAVLVDLAQSQIHSYVLEPERGRPRWSGKRREQRAVCANRYRVRSARSKRYRNCGASCVNAASRTSKRLAHCGDSGCAARSTY